MAFCVETCYIMTSCQEYLELAHKECVLAIHFRQAWSPGVIEFNSQLAAISVQKVMFGAETLTLGLSLSAACVTFLASRALATNAEIMQREL